MRGDACDIAGRGARALANGRAIDMVFSDVMMPGGMSGVELSHEITQAPAGVPVVLATGYIEAARDAMADGLEVLVKPYNSKRWRAP